MLVATRQTRPVEPVPSSRLAHWHHAYFKHHARTGPSFRPQRAARGSGDDGVEAGAHAVDAAPHRHEQGRRDNKKESKNTHYSP